MIRRLDWRSFGWVLMFVALLWLWVTPAHADTIVSTNLDDWLISDAGPLLLGPTDDVFDPAPPAVDPVGLIRNWVYENDSTGLFTYVHLIEPLSVPGQFVNTGFPVLGFTGIAGWSYSDSVLAGGTGAGDFLLQGAIGDSSPISWTAIGDLWNDWDLDEAIALFFVSTHPPNSTGNYNFTATATGTAQSYMPTPEPSTLLLLGSGLAAAYWRHRKRG